MKEHILSIIIFLPLISAILTLMLPSENKMLLRRFALFSTFLSLVLSLILIFSLSKWPADGLSYLPDWNFQRLEQHAWILLDLGNFGKLSITYLVGLDGLNAGMVLLSAIVLFIGVIASWKIEKNLKGYFALYFLLAGSIYGCFLSLDFFLFYLFFEFMLLPMYFLIGLWGGPRKEYAAIKFFLYTLSGSLFILIVMIGLYLSVIDPVLTAVEIGLVPDVANVNAEHIQQVHRQLSKGLIPKEKLVHTFNMLAMMDNKNFIPGSVLSILGGANWGGHSPRMISFLLLFLGFIIKLPAVPFHTWLPDAHVEAPTPISVVLAGILLKVGAYGLLRIPLGIFPEGIQQFAFPIAILGLISLIYGSLNALAMKDLKKLIAYSSVAHMGFVLLGISAQNAEGLQGAIYMMFSHGLISSMLFLIAGVLYDRTHDRMIASYSGLSHRMPAFTIMVIIAFFASFGMPGFAGFIAEILVFLGIFTVAGELYPLWLPILCTLGLALSAAYYLWTLQRMFFGSFWIKPELAEANLKDLTTREYSMLLPLAIAIFIFGIFPNLFLELSTESVNNLVEIIQEQGGKNLAAILKLLGR